MHLFMICADMSSFHRPSRKLVLLLKSKQNNYLITRNAVIALYVLLECLKWISMLFRLSNIAYPYSIDCLSLVNKTEAIA